MANRWMMGHSWWLLVFVLVFGFRDGSCDISLTMERTVTGVKGDLVVIPCTYTASKDDEVLRIDWEFKGQAVIYRTESQDHRPLVKYRDRVAISESPAGDVSLTIRKLDMDDKGDFKCKVTGKDGKGKQITQEDISTLKVLRTRPTTNQPEVTTAEDEVTTEASSVGDDSAIATTKQPRKFRSSTVPIYPFTTAVMHNNPAADAIKGSGLLFYLLIICLFCIVAVLILIIVLTARRKKRKNFQYNLPSMNQLAINLEGRSCGGDCQSSVGPAMNNYEPCFPVSEYQSLPAFTNEYEQLVIRIPEEKGNHCQPSQ